MSNTDSELDSLLQHVQETWKLKRAWEDLQTEKRRLQSELNNLNTQELTLKKELREAKRLMDHCLETGEDATSVKLIKDSSDLVRWEYESHKYQNATEKHIRDLLMNRVGALGATGP